jgi:hypothetical protein
MARCQAYFMTFWLTSVISTGVRMGHAQRHRSHHSYLSGADLHAAMVTRAIPTEVREQSAEGLH